MQDVIPPGKRSIKQIPIPPGRGRRLQAREEDLHARPAQSRITPAEVTRRESVEPHRYHNNYDIQPEDEFAPLPRKKTPKLLWAIALLCVFGAFFGLAYAFEGAEVTVSPKREKMAIDGTFSAKKDAKESLGFNLTTLSKEGKKEIPALREETVNTKASGRIIIYNNYSNAPQTLIANTRFETKEGLIFRIDKQVVVPGIKTEEGKPVPGSVEVIVYADEPGDRYNIKLSDFTIPGFKGDPRYEKFYARSKTEMTGGYVGKKQVADQSAIDAARKALRDELRTDLLRQAGAQAPEGYIVYDKGYAVQYESLPDAQGSATVEVREKATLNIFLWSYEALQKAIVSKYLSPERVQTVVVRGIGALTFNDGKEIDVAASINEIEFTLKGEIEIVGNVDDEKLKEELIGKPKSSVKEVFAQYPAIEKADATIRPFWKTVFPSSKDSIRIVNTAAK